MAKGTWQPPFALKQANGADPFPTFKFWVEIKSIVVAEFKECTGLSMTREPEKVEEGGVNDYVHYLPGRNEYSRIVLKHGLADADALWDWYQQGLRDGRVKMINFSILLRNVQGDVVKRWNVIEGFPVKWEGPSLNTEGNQVAVETLEIVHHGLVLDKP